MTHYPNGFVPDIECRRCDGNGWIEVRRHGLLRGVHQEDCPECCGHGWRPMNEDELDAAAEQQAEDAMSEPPASLAEQHRDAWAQKQELRR